MNETWSSIRWQLDEDGGGTAWVVSKDGDGFVESKYVFDSLKTADQIPPDLANVIRNDGRTSGEIP